MEVAQVKRVLRPDAVPVTEELVAEGVEGAQCLIVNSKISERMVEIAEVGAIPSVLGSAAGKGKSDSVQTYSMSEME